MNEKPNDLSLEKLKMHERLGKVEKYMETGEASRKTLMAGLERLKESVDGIETTLFGSKDEDGIVKQMKAMLKIADGIKWVLTKILMAIITAVSLAMIPSIFGYISKIMSQHTGV